MPEFHRLSYVGDSQLVESFLKILTRHNLVHHPDASAPQPIEPGKSFAASDPFSIVASGGYDTAETDIADAIADFAAQFPDRANTTDGGAMPSDGVLTFRGRHDLIDDLCLLLNLEQVEILYPEEDDDWASVEEQIEADPDGDGAIELSVIGWGDLRRPVAAATAAFVQRHPGQGRIDFDSGDPVPGAPVVLIAEVNDGTGRMTASRAGESAFTEVTDLADAMMAALSRQVDLLVPHSLFLNLRSEFPPALPDWIKVK